MLENQNSAFTSYIKCYEKQDGNNFIHCQENLAKCDKLASCDKQTSDIRRTQSMKSIIKDGCSSNVHIDTEVKNSEKAHSDQDSNEAKKLSLRKNVGDKSYVRMSSHDPSRTQKSASLTSPVSIRRRNSFASGSSPYLDSSRRKVTSHNLFPNCGRRILTALEEDKVLTHQCERRLGGRSPLSEASYNSENIVSESTARVQGEGKTDHGNQRLSKEDPDFVSSENLPKHSVQLIRRDSLRDFETPFKVYKKSSQSIIKRTSSESRFYEMQSAAYRTDGYFKAMSAKNSVSSNDNQISSCQAIRIALSTLYNLDDFHSDKIGEGFFSEVFKVVHKGMGKVMVLKKNKHRANRNNMLKEVQLMNTLKHENILKYEGACVADGQLHALVEYINGGSLEDLIVPLEYGNGHDDVDRGLSPHIEDYSEAIDKQQELKSLYPELPWSTRISIAQDISNGLSYLHSQGIFHRDLTSKNVLIRKEGGSEGDRNTAFVSAVVADFGLAANIPVDTNERLLQVGSPYWMSPECLRGEFYDHKSDVFSFGIILCELIARCRADPDYLPRTANFGVDYRLFCESMVHDSCPPEFLKIAFSCVTINPLSRPEFERLYDDLSDLYGEEALLDGKKHISFQGKQESDEMDFMNSVSDIVKTDESSPADLDKISASKKKELASLPNSEKSKLQTKSPQQFRRFPVRSRRCVTQRNFPKYSPSEYARHHSPSGPMNFITDDKSIPVHITPVAVAEEMSRLDPHYIPSKTPGVNPFAMLPRSLTENGKYGKIIGAKDLFCSCFELSSDVIGVGRNLTKSVTMPAKDYNAGSEENNKTSLVDDELAVVQRRAISLINPPTSIINNLALSEGDMPKSA